MIIPILYVLFGWAFLFFCLTDSDFNEQNVLNTWFERLLIIFVWPACIVVLALWAFCRDDEEPGRAIL